MEREWRALPGNILTYGDTGFEIRLSSDPKEPAYTLYDPEGRSLRGLNASGLEELKMMAERAADSRAEFELKTAPNSP